MTAAPMHLGRARLGRPHRRELLVLLAILALAALTRLPGIAERGRWDADQGHDMLVLRALATGGEIPLLGPKTSIGTFHHGAVYYYLLAPAAIASSSSPVAVTGEIALFGIAAVAGAWWLARLLGGPLAAVAAGFLAAISPAGIDESTFIWNPNLIPAAAALAFAAAIMARRTGRARWWLASGVGALVTMQCHVLGVVIMAPLAWAWAADLVRRRHGGHDTRPVIRGGLGAALVIAAGFLPLVVYELGHDFAETRAILDYLAGGGRPGGVSGGSGVAERAILVGLRSITWPVTGLITDRVTVSLVTAMAVTLLGAVALVGRRRGDAGAPSPAVAVASSAAASVVGPAGSAATPVGSAAAPAGSAATPAVDLPSARWLAAGLGVSVLALAAFAPSLAVIVPGLPNDHYHAFLDPVVLALVGVGLARLATTATAGRVVAGALAVVLVGIAVTAWPPAVSPDGGWPLADDAAARVLDSAGSAPLGLDGIPPFKSADALRFPLERRGAHVAPEAAPVVATGELPPGGPVAAGLAPGDGVMVLVCDPLFNEVVGAPCGGPAEDAWQSAGTNRTGWGLVERFDAGPRRVISIYALKTVPDATP